MASTRGLFGSSRRLNVRPPFRSTCRTYGNRPPSQLKALRTDSTHQRPGRDCTGARALLDHVVSASAAVPQQPIKSTPNSAGRNRAARTLFHPEGLVHTEDVVAGHSLWVLELAQE